SSGPKTGFPEGWEIRHSNSKNVPYCFHPASKDSRWEPPAGIDPDRLKAYMAKSIQQ
ncbi:protein kinase ssp1, partial [Paraphaeosphaeria minitans]